MITLMDDIKKDKIKNSLKLTKLKRKAQRCKNIELKVDYSKLNKQQKNCLKMFFIEAKWFYNFILSQENCFNFSSKTTVINVLNKNKQLEQKELKYLPAKNKQDIVKLLHQNIYALSALKKKRYKVGRLRFKSSYNSIHLSQYNVTHKIISKNKIKINGIKKYIHVHGLDQVKQDHEIANAKLIQKASGYYIKLTCYEPIKLIIEKKKEAVGIDFGIKNNLTLSNNKTINVFVEETERLKRLQQKLARQIKGSNNRYKTCIKIKKEYEKITNKKEDTANKIVNYLLSAFDKVCIQDEQLHDWHKNYGKQVQHSCMGRVKNKLTQHKSVFVLNKWYPSTKKCYNCDKMNEILLNENVYKCSNCGLIENRDVKAAKTIKYQFVPMECRDIKSVENITSVFQISPFANVSCVQ
jgi:putative transposase